MRKRRIGYAVWLLLAAGLYFFENNTGTRIILLCSVLFPLLPVLREAFFRPDESGKEEAPETLTVKTFSRTEEEEPGDVRAYRPGDPVRRIHWKLSAKKDELLIREAAAVQETAREERREDVSGKGRKKDPRGRIAAGTAAGLAVCLALLLLIPEARLGAQRLCNRLFAASEAVNAYAYEYFPVPEEQGTALAAGLGTAAVLAFAALVVLLRSRLLTLGAAAACTVFQVYFGLAFPAWVNIPLYALSALWMTRRPMSRKALTVCCAAVLLVSVLVAALLPGTDAATEAASEKVRDALSRAAAQITGTAPEEADGEAETRHVHTQSMETGNREARTEREYRLVTVEEEQISMPHWVNWLKMILLLLLSVAVVVLPFLPFLLLNARKKRTLEARKAFASENVAEAVRAVFQQVIAWLEATGSGAGNRLYREWEDLLPDSLPEGYGARFARCAEDYEEAVYSDHAMPEEKRQDALRLLKETEEALWKNAGRRQRFRLKYWMCLCE